jgi:hypothetical protein
MGVQVKFAMEYTVMVWKQVRQQAYPTNEPLQMDSDVLLM